MLVALCHMLEIKPWLTAPTALFCL